MLPLLTLMIYVASAAAQTKYFGINIAGFDFTVKTDGSFVNQPSTTPDGQGQMAHFVKDDGMNLFRLPCAWQYLTPTLGGTLDATNFATYDKLVQLCLAQSVHCIIDIHNYARWNGKIIGQGGPTNDQFTSLWSQIATKYAKEDNIIFGIMNEPHDMPDISIWATTVQEAVTAIRKAGATSQMILLPGNDYASAATFVSGGSAAALSKVQNPDGSTTNLIFDVHKYLDADGSGTHPECVSDHISDAFQPLAAYLKKSGRQAMVTESGGGGDTASCLKYLTSAFTFINKNSDVYLGYTTWSAGGFSQTDNLGETPTFDGGKWMDWKLVTQGVVGTHGTLNSSSNSTEKVAQLKAGSRKRSFEYKRRISRPH